MGTFQDISICQRIAKVRSKTFGPRGKASFAKRLGISPSTYDYYENGRIPPADLLLKIADAGGVDLRWLLTGESAGGAATANHPAVRRVAELLGDHPQAAEPLLAFLDILEGTLAFPQKNPAMESTEPLREQPQPSAPVTALPETAPSEITEPLPAPPVIAADAQHGWIPILGRSAAGVPHFWANDEDATGLTTLGELIARCTESPADQQAQPGQAIAGARDVAGANTAAQPVQIITLRTPIAWGQGGEVAQFIAAAAIKAQYPGAFAVRIDGDSMSPEIYHGDLVVLSATAPAAAGMPAVVQITGAVGVTCKLYHPAEVCTTLLPINEDGQTITVANRQIEWALRVLARIRPFAGD